MRMKEISGGRGKIRFAKYDEWNMTISDRLEVAPVEPSTPREFDLLMDTLGYMWGRWDPSVKKYWETNVGSDGDKGSKYVRYICIEPEDRYLYWSEHMSSLISSRDAKLFLHYFERDMNIRALNPRQCIDVLEREMREGNHAYEHCVVERPQPGHYRISSSERLGRVFYYLVDLSRLGT